MAKKQLHVLLVDDDEINRLVATTFLKKWNVSVTIATDGKHALDLVSDKRFDLIMMDLQMPEMDGYECTRRIRSMVDPYFQKVPILVFSASTIIDTRQKAMSHGMTDFMNKPFRQEELREKIGMYVDLTTDAVRPLKIDFAVHTGGDPAFKIELMHLLADNLRELKQAAKTLDADTDSAPFFATTHKVNSAITILNDSELDSAVQTLKQHLKAGERSALKENITWLCGIIDEITSALDHEIKVMQNSERN